MGKTKTTLFSIKYPKDFGKQFSLNKIYSGLHWSIRKSHADFWKRITMIELKRQGKTPCLFSKPVHITFMWNDKLDCSNHAYVGKMIEDSLKGFYIQDDTKKYVKAITHMFHEKDYITVMIKEI